MKAMIFAAGLGTRLRPLTDSRPKALVEVAGRPMLDRVMEHLAECGVESVVVNVHHFAPLIEKYIASHTTYGMDVTVSDETDLLLDTGGGIKKAAPLLAGDDPVIIHNADILTDIDLRAMVRRHVETGADATLLTAPRRSSRYLAFDADDRLRGWTNVKTGEVKPAGADLATMSLEAFGGVHVISPSLLGRISAYSDNPVFSIIPFYVDNAADCRFMSYSPSPDSYLWHDIGSIDKLAAAERALATL